MTAPGIDTIVAIATPPGRGAVGILRLSGPQARCIARALCAADLPPARQARLRHFRDAQGRIVDQGLAVNFPGPQSFTGEDVVELQGHGGPVILDALLRAAATHGARIARPGEFSERAFLNGRLDLAQAEAIADLIAAGSAQAARAAQRSLDGELSRRVQALTEALTDLRAYVEGALDFADEDGEWLAEDALRARLLQLGQGLATLTREADQGRRLRDGLQVTLTGAPNVGKSTLYNRLAGADAAIVTDLPGTTRDLLRESLEVDGVPLTLVDSAGLREGGDVVEVEGQRRARAALAQSQVALFVIDDRAGVTAADGALLATLPPGPQRLIVHNKCDLSGANPAAWTDGPVEHLRLSAASGAGLDLLRAALRRCAGIDAGETPFLARARHVDALRRASAFVQDARARILEGATAELAAEELRLAQQALAEITGAFTTEDLLGRIFSTFCLGK